MSLKTILKELDITLTNTLLTIAFLGGLLLTVWEVDIYHKTFIPAAVPVLVWLSPGLILTGFLRNFLAPHIRTTSLFLQFVFNTGSWGGILVYFFMALNFYAASGNTIPVNLPITHYGEFAKGRYGCEPYVEVVYNDQEKQLVFPCGTAVESYKTVKLGTRKGLWGYEVIASQELVR